MIKGNCSDFVQVNFCESVNCKVEVHSRFLLAIKTLPIVNFSVCCIICDMYTCKTRANSLTVSCILL